MKTDAFGYTIGDVLCLLAFGTRLNGVIFKTNLGKLHQVTFFLRKMILAEIQYKTRIGELFAITKAFII